MSTLKPGAVLHQRYTVIGLIGSGGMGAVYLTDDNRLEGRRCAVKETRVLADMSLDALETLRHQFRLEASVLARLDHPNLPKVSDFFSAETRDYLVMDYVAGQDLSQVVAAARAEGRYLDEATVLEWLDQLCDALIYLHSQSPPILHRDVKPANIKLTPDGWAKMVDFGLVKPLDPDDPRTITSLRGIGSLPYTPLEQYVGDLGHTDPRSDLYALGATLYHLLTGEVPPSAQDRFLDPASLRSPRTVNPAISVETELAILAATAMHPQDRPSSVSAWRATLPALSPALAPPALLDRGPTTVGFSAPTQPTPASADTVRANSVLVVIAILLVVLALFMTFVAPVP